MKKLFGIKKLPALVLAGAVLLSGALAAGAEEKFPTINTYPGYADVQETDWFYQNAKLCYEIGIMTGTDTGFAPNAHLTNAECVTLAARLGAALRGDTIRPAQPEEEWWEPYREYRFPNGGGGVSYEGTTRWDFLFMLYPYVYEAELLEPINAITALPDSDDAMVLAYYNAGILTGTDKYGSFQGGKGLTRAEAAAMISRIVRPELRLEFAPADISMFLAARMTPYTGLFQDVYAKDLLPVINEHIAKWEAALGDDFNWHADTGDGKTVLEHVKEDPLTSFWVSQQDAWESYKDFDVQVYYSRLIDLTGGPLGQTGAPKVATEAPQAYTLTEIALPEGWRPAADPNDVSTG